MTSPTRPSLPTLAFAASILGFALAPPSGVLRATVHGAVGVAAVIAAWGALRRIPAGRRRGWWLLAVGLTTIVAGDIGTATARLMASSASLTLRPWHLLYPIGTLVLALGLGRLTRDPKPDRTATLDAVTVSTGICVVVWVALVEPVWASMGSTTIARLHIVLYPVAHLVLLVLTVRLAMLGDRRPAGSRWLVGGATLQLLAAAGVAGGIVLGVYGPGSILDITWMGASVMVARGLRTAAATGAVIPPPPDRQRISPRRIAALGLSLLLLPTLMVTMATDASGLLVAGATGVLLTLVTIRIVVLVRELEHARDRAVADQEHRAQRRLEAIVRHAADAVLVVGTDGFVSYASPAARQVFGHDPVGWHHNRLATHIHADERRATMNALLERLAERTGRPIQLHARLEDRADREHHVELVAVDLSDDPDVNGVVFTVHETTERTELEAKLRRLAFQDTLTGLSNREVFQDRLAQALKRAARTGRHLAVLICDLDDFKDVNDTLGHVAGDQLLQQLATRLKAVTRATDTVARLGGDEFAMLCEGLPSTREAVLTARRLLGTVDEPLTVAGSQLKIGMSVGIAVDTGERSGEELLRDADIALYEAKADGKQRWSLHRTTMTLRAQARLELAADLERDTRDGELDVVYQPIVALDEGRVVGAEALARWKHHTRGVVDPDEFIPVAEQSGLILAVGDLVLRRALSALRRWTDARPELVLRIGVNCSARQLHDPQLTSRVLAMLEEEQLDPSVLVLELTESVMLGDVEAALKVMHALRNAGVRFAIDDFGTGYSSLSYLRRLPVDIVKIDRSFVTELSSDPAARDLVQTIIDLGSTLHLDVLAEGVETEEQRATLARMGCAFAQGYLFSPPVPADTLGTTLAMPETPVVLGHRVSAAVGGSEATQRDR